MADLLRKPFGRRSSGRFLGDPVRGAFAASYPIVGMTNSGSLLTPVGQRVVIVLRRV